MQSFLSTSSVCSSTTPLSVEQSRAAFMRCTLHSDACCSEMALQRRSNVSPGGRLRVADKVQCGVSRGSSVTYSAGTSPSLRRNSPSSLSCSCMPGGLRNVVRNNIAGASMLQSCSRGTANSKMLQRIGCQR